MRLALSIFPRSGAKAEPPQPLWVLKFGSSLLRSPEDLPRVAGEIYRQRRAGRRIVAVVSALAGETDRLLREAAALTGPAQCRGIPDLVSLGEERAAALLRLACERIGLPAEICRAEDLGILTEGDALDARPVRLEERGLARKLQSTGLVIVPGFVGRNEAGERALLGRGGSDHSAIFIGGELGAERVRLYKDVDGVFEADPSRCDRAGRFSRISWSEALRVARPLIQPQGIEYAARKRLTIEVQALGSASATQVGPHASRAEPARPEARLRVSLAGFGAVGQALVERLRDERRFEIVAILVRNPSRPRAVEPPVPPTASVAEFLATPSDILVDALSCESTAGLLCTDMLGRGRDIVSASKRLISAGHADLSGAARKAGSRLLYSAAVGGSANILETIDRARAKGRIEEVTGILNGTVNFVLQRLSQGLPFEEALSEARTRGFAEDDPEADLSGADAAAKLRLIAHRATGIDPRAMSVATEGLDAATAERLGAGAERWVQVASFRRGSLESQASVRLVPLREVPELPLVLDEWNCAALRLTDGTVYRCVGRGAGGAATAEAIIADLYELLHERTARPVRPEALAC